MCKTEATTPSNYEQSRSLLFLIRGGFISVKPFTLNLWMEQTGPVQQYSTGGFYNKWLGTMLESSIQLL